MPKMKTHRGAAKRFKISGSGKIMRVKAYHGHLLEKKTSKQKARLSETVEVAKTNVKALRRLLGRGRG